MNHAPHASRFLPVAEDEAPSERFCVSGSQAVEVFRLAGRFPEAIGSIVRNGETVEVTLRTAPEELGAEAGSREALMSELLALGAVAVAPGEGAGADAVPAPVDASGFVSARDALEGIEIAGLLVSAEGQVLWGTRRACALLTKAFAASGRAEFARRALVTPQSLRGRPLGDVLKSPLTASRLVENGFRAGPFELELGEAHVIVDPRPAAAGQGFLVLRSLADLGRHVSALTLAGDGQEQRMLPTRAHAARQAWDQLDRAAGHALPVLITGPAGSGHLHAARACHRRSALSAEPFLALNGAAAAEEALEHQLFGVQGKPLLGPHGGSLPGLLELVGRGTLFLEGLERLPARLQERLAETLSTGVFRRVGGETAIAFEGRLIGSLTAEGGCAGPVSGMSEALFYAICRLNVDLPGLSECREDIEALAEAAVARADLRARSDQSLRHATHRLQPCAVDFLRRRAWQAHLVELDALIADAVFATQNPVLEASDLAISAARWEAVQEGDAPETLPADPAPAADPTSAAASSSAQIPVASNRVAPIQPADAVSQPVPLGLHEAVKRFEADYLRALYPQFPSSRRLARELKVSHTTIAQKLKTYRITN